MGLKILWLSKHFGFLIKVTTVRKKKLLFVAYRILVPRPGIEPVLPAETGQSLNHWTAREILEKILIWNLLLPRFCTQVQGIHNAHPWSSVDTTPAIGTNWKKKNRSLKREFKKLQKHEVKSLDLPILSHRCGSRVFHKSGDLGTDGSWC